MINNSQSSWVTAVSAMPFSDLAISGSSNNQLNLYQLSANKRSISQINTIHVDGIVNDIRFSNDNRFVGVALGRDYKLGRWFTSPPGCKSTNQLVLIDLNKLKIHEDATVVSNDTEEESDTPISDNSSDNS